MSIMLLALAFAVSCAGFIAVKRSQPTALFRVRALAGGPQDDD